MSTINRKDLLSALHTVSPGLSSGESIQQSSCFVFSEGRVFTYNEEMLCSMPIDIGITGAVSADPLMKLIDKMSEDEITITKSEGHLRVKGKNKSGNIKFDHEVMLPIDKVPLPKKWLKIEAGFVDGLDLVKDCCATSDLHFGLRCIHIMPDFLEACDNIQACRVKVKTGVSEETLIRGESASHLSQAGITQFSESKNWMHFKTPNDAVFSCRRYVSKYPDLADKVFTFKGSSITIPKGLSEATEKAAIFIATSNTSVTKQDLVNVTLSNGRIKVTGHGDLGWYSESKKIDYSGKELEFSIAPNVLSRIAKEHTKAAVSSDKLCIDGESWRLIFCLFKKGKVVGAKEDSDE